ncbi:helix-turn-helix domain-containing protein [Mesorhizobium intechi]|uniref:Helix-turn-helix domain-containing protein n=1 Tax=Mesorhizobium intechi TaxID=537601 RepID=A0A8T9AYD8_9HYPH|nr:helix-turn-helix domain-containing protein [Mesorhizobium intechi]TSE13800.1 helix-turn-helix domain-containing protein [Mesorhizobium intechi]
MAAAGNGRDVVPGRALADGGVPRSVLDSAGLGPRQAVAMWQENMGFFYDVRLRNGGDERFHVHAEAFHLGEIALSSYRCVAQNFDRSRARIGRDGLDQITVQVCLRGSHGRRDGGPDEKACAGDLIVSDLAQVQSTGTSGIDSVNLTMPRRLLAPLLKAPDEHNLRVIPGNAPLTALLRGHLIGLYEAAPAMSGSDAEAVTRPTIELAAAAINSAVAEENAASVQLALTGEIRRHIDRHITGRDLTAETIAALFGISMRKLYYLFEPHGGFSRYIQDERLRRCRAELVDPGRRHDAIGEIAGRYGFGHRKSFVRAFRRSFDMTPREMRALAAEGRRRTREHGADRTLWHCIREIR